MRPFIQTTAGATFFLGIPHTLMFRKDYVEIIFKLENGFYGVVNFVLNGKDDLVAPHGLGRFLQAHIQSRGPGQTDADVAETLSVGGGRDDGQIRFFAGKKPGQQPIACRLHRSRD